VKQERILVTGATGYIGGRLLRALEVTGRPLRLLARRAESVRDGAAPATKDISGVRGAGDSLMTMAKRSSIF